MNISFKDKQKTLFSRIKYLREHSTTAERMFKSLLDKLEIKYIFQKSFIKGNAYVIVDFYLPKPYKLCIEIDGGYHLTQKSKDNRKDEYLKSRGFKILRFTNDEVNSLDSLRLNNTIIGGWGCC